MGTRLMAFYEDLLDIAQHSTFNEPTLYAAYIALVDLSMLTVFTSDSLCAMSWRALLHRAALQFRAMASLELE